jgi:hypothetical protein
VNPGPEVTIDALRARDQAEALQARLAAAADELASHPTLERERRWVAEASTMIADGLAALAPLLQASQKLPERVAERPVFARVPQGAWVDSLERLYSGLAYHLGPRAPVIEALFPHTKFPVLRKPKPEAVREYAEGLAKRRLGSYVQRILAEPEAAFAAPLLENVAATLHHWEDTLTGPSLDEEAAHALRVHLARALGHLRLTHRQAKLLVDAASLALPEPATTMPIPSVDEPVQSVA